VNYKRHLDLIAPCSEIADFVDRFKHDEEEITVLEKLLQNERFYVLIVTALCLTSLFLLGCLIACIMTVKALNCCGSNCERRVQVAEAVQQTNSSPAPSHQATPRELTRTPSLDRSRTPQDECSLGNSPSNSATDIKMGKMKRSKESLRLNPIHGVDTPAMVAVKEKRERTLKSACVYKSSL